jgi:hypothetical protein
MKEPNTAIMMNAAPGHGLDTNGTPTQSRPPSRRTAISGQ